MVRGSHKGVREPGIAAVSAPNAPNVSPLVRLRAATGGKDYEFVVVVSDPVESVVASLNSEAITASNPWLRW